MKKKITACILGIMALSTMMGTAFAGDRSASEIAREKEFASKPYVQVQHTPEEYRKAAAMGDRDKEWDREALAKPYQKTGYSGEDLRQGAEKMQQLNREK